MEKAQRKGVVLIVVLGVLTILSLLGVMFVRLAALERTSASASVDLLRARLSAHSGVERAIVQLKSLLAESLILDYTRWSYYGEDLNGNGKLDPGEDQNQNGTLDTLSCPLKLALRPSFFVDQDKDNLPDLITIMEAGNLKSKACSGYLPGTYKTNGDFYTLKVVDTSSQIYVNGKNQSLERILNNLGKVLKVGDNLGTQIITERQKCPGGKFTSKYEVENIVGKEVFQKIEPFITIWAWVDSKVIKPKPLSERISYKHPVTGIINRADLDSPVYGWDELNPVTLDLEPRAPVNINTAGKEILISLLAELQGFYLKEEPLPGFNTHYVWHGAQFSYREGWIGKSTPFLSYDDGLNGTILSHLNAWLGNLKTTEPISFDTAGYASQSETIAQKIIDRRAEKPFTNWQDFNQFVDEKLVQEKIIDEYQGAVIKSNFNPNTDINDFNPNAILYKHIDKSDLINYSTEFCFLPTGYFEIESEVTVLHQDKIMAQSSITTVVQLFQIYHETSQEDFTRGTISDKNAPYETHKGKSLQTYPEPDINEYPRNTYYDGQIMLATIESKESDALLYANFADSLDATKGGNPKLVPDLQGPYTNRLINVITGETTPIFDHPGNLFPDGCYSERYSSIIYNALGNINTPDKGAGVSFWLKPNFYPENAWKFRTLFSMSKWGGEETSSGCEHNEPDRRNCLFGLFFIPAHNSSSSDTSHPYGGYGPSIIPFPPRSFAFGWARLRFGQQCGTVSPSLNNTGLTKSSSEPILAAHKWVHIGITWQTDLAATRGDGWSGGNARLSLHINGKYMGTQFGPSKWCNPGHGSTVETFLVNNFIRFGELANLSPLYKGVTSISNFVADATFDEINTYPSISTASILAQFNEGRYYHENDATFISGPIELPKIISSRPVSDKGLKGYITGDETGSTTTPATPPPPDYITPDTGKVIGICWTQYIPRALKDSASLEFQISTDNGINWKPTTYTDADWSKVDITGTGPIKYKVVFKIAGGLNTQLLESPVLDDVTIYFAIKPRLVTWLQH